MATDLDRLCNLIEGREHSIEILEKLLADAKKECRKLDETEISTFRKIYLDVATYDIEIATLNY